MNDLIQKNDLKGLIKLSKTKKTQEQLLNRILINIGIAVLAYICLYVLYAKFYLTPAIPIATAFIVIAIIGYVVSAAKILKVVNYAHMFLAFGFALLFTRLSIFTVNIIGIEKFMALHNSSAFFRILMNSQKEVTLLTWLGAVYLVGMLIYNTILINKAGKK